MCFKEYFKRKVIRSVITLNYVQKLKVKKYETRATEKAACWLID